MGAHHHVLHWVLHPQQLGVGIAHHARWKPIGQCLTEKRYEAVECEIGERQAPWACHRLRVNGVRMLGERGVHGIRIHGRHARARSPGRSFWLGCP